MAKRAQREDTAKRASTSKATDTAGRRKQQRRAAKRAAALPADDEPPADGDEFRRALARRIMTLLGLPRRCHDRNCRRHGRCEGADLRYQRDFPGPPMTPEQQAAALASLYKALTRRGESQDA